MSHIELRPPRVGDAAGIHRLAERSGRLDVNTRYAYLIWCRDFARTSIVAEKDGRLAGFVTGYRCPDRPDTLFAWQSAVDPDDVVPGLAQALMEGLIQRLVPEGVRSFEATLDPANRAVVMLTRRLARAHGGDLHTEVLFDTAELGTGHEPEVLYRFSVGGPARRTETPQEGAA